MKDEKHHLVQDLGIVALSVVIAIVLLKTGAIEDLLISSQTSKIIGSFIAGVFFVSVFTAAPATAALVEIALSNSLFLTAFFGALGAVSGDLIIFSFVKDRFSEDLMWLLKERGGINRSKALFKSKFFRRVTFIVGGIIIASPFPDELGIGMLGFSKIKTSLFVLISFLCNFAGILLIGIAVKSLF